MLADYGRLVPSAVLDLPRHGALNLHPSLLPRHRGAAPIPAAILAGDAETGVTLMRMDEGLDTGPIVAQRRVPLSGDETAPELEGRLAEVAAELLVATLPAWLAGRLDATPQPEDGATLTRPLRREDGRLDPVRRRRELERQVRAYQPWPGSFLDDGPTRLIVWQASAHGPSERRCSDLRGAGRPRPRRRLARARHRRRLAPTRRGPARRSQPDERPGLPPRAALTGGRTVTASAASNGRRR